jgi:hypothetical protein
MASCSLEDIQILKKSTELFEIVASLDINNPEDQKLLKEIEEKLKQKNNTVNAQHGGKCDSIQNTLKATAVLAALAVSVGASCYYNFRSVLSYIGPDNIAKLTELYSEYKEYYKLYDDSNKYGDPISYYLAYVELPIRGYSSMSSAICKILFNDRKLEEITEILKEQRRVKKGRTGKGRSGKKGRKNKGNKF